MCHVPRATNRLMAGTIVVPAFWRVEWCHAGPGRTSRSGAIPENAWTHILTDRQTRPANYFSPTHQWKSSFIERSMLKHLNVHSLRFWTRGRLCLIALPWAKIVDKAMFKFNRGLCYTTEVPYQFASAYVHDSPIHLESCTIEVNSWNLIGIPIPNSLARSFPK